MKNESFIDLYGKDVSDKIKKKGKYSYLSWVYAWIELKKKWPGACPVRPEYSDINGTAMVTTGFEVDGDEYLWTHAVRNHSMKAVQNPTSADFEVSAQRCLTKAIAVHTGIGLSLYAGEDIPRDISDKPKAEQKQMKVATVMPLMSKLKDFSTVGEVRAFYAENEPTLDAAAVETFMQACKARAEELGKAV